MLSLGHIRVYVCFAESFLSFVGSFLAGFFVCPAWRLIQRFLYAVWWAMTRKTGRLIPRILLHSRHPIASPSCWAAQRRRQNIKILSSAQSASQSPWVSACCLCLQWRLAWTLARLRAKLLRHRTLSNSWRATSARRRPRHLHAPHSLHGGSGPLAVLEVSRCESCQPAATGSGVAAALFCWSIRFRARPREGPPETPYNGDVCVKGPVPAA